MFQVKELKNGLTFKIQVTPHASRAEIVGFQDGALKLKVTARPLDGAANVDCIKLLAQALELRKSQLKILAGAKSRKKIIFATDINKKDLEAKINDILD